MSSQKSTEFLENFRWRPPNSEYRSPPKQISENRNRLVIAITVANDRTPRNYAGRIRNATDVTRKNILLSIARLILARSVTNFMTAIKALRPLDGDPVRDGLKTPPKVCVLAYVEPELKRQDQDIQQSMNVYDEDLLVKCSLSDDSQSKLSDDSGFTMRP
ncbi:hypothetical protein PHMEG_00013111 [Phytophthora megakarya]|uniref:Uncharacterized protein n=1 Tax=Phytophthora megakarya TaxID=4795 RepID=A0A225W713_9STRA|nr:hypothetical protein PHMEG_00013111 [Phytophthora megakarya]